MNIQELHDRIAGQAFTMNKAKTRGFMVAQETDRMRNVLMNSLDEIIEALDYAAKADVRVERMAAEVDAADRELAEKDEEIAELKKSKGKGKKTNVEQGAQ